MASSLAMFFLLLLLATAAASAATTPNTTRVEQACSRTLHADFCVKSLSADPNTHTADDVTLAGIAVRIAADKATEAAMFAAAIQMDAAREGDVDEGLGQCLADCSDNFVSAVGQLNSATPSLSDGDYGTSVTLLKAAMADAASCNEGCKAGAPDGGAAVETMEQKSEEFFKMCNIALVLTELLSKSN